MTSNFIVTHVIQKRIEYLFSLWFPVFSYCFRSLNFCPDWLKSKMTLLPPNCVHSPECMDPFVLSWFQCCFGFTCQESKFSNLLTKAGERTWCEFHIGAYVLPNVIMTALQMRKRKREKDTKVSWISNL